MEPVETNRLRCRRGNGRALNIHFRFQKAFRLSVIFTKKRNAMEIIFTLDDIQNVAKDFIKYSRAYKVFAFSGELGAGKTTFIHAVCKEIGVKETVTSPTYAIIQEYHLPKIKYYLPHRPV